MGEPTDRQTDKATKSVGQFVGTDKPTLFDLIIRVFIWANRQTDRPTNRQNLSVNLSVPTLFDLIIRVFI